jgi:hypothetical protein
MSDLTQRIQAAQIRAGEEVVMANLDPALRTQEPDAKAVYEAATKRVLITYRDLSPAELALVAEAKALGELVGAFIEKLRQHPATVPRQQPTADGGVLPSLDQRWVSIGATHLQEGWMAVIRGIAQPTTF